MLMKYIGMERIAIFDGFDKGDSQTIWLSVVTLSSTVTQGGEMKTWLLARFLSFLPRFSGLSDLGPGLMA